MGFGVEERGLIELAETTTYVLEKQDSRKTGCFETRMFFSFSKCKIKCFKKARNQSESGTDRERASL